MKSSKAALQTSNEECGVWLDTVQLKQKNKKKLPVRPISKLLNPLTKGDGYSIAVALNFTQTKMEMPKTKQSSISAFFAPHRRVLNKMSTSEEANLDPEQDSSSSTSPAPTAPSFQKKRGRDICVETLDWFTAQHELAPEWDDEVVTESQTLQWQMSTTSYPLPENMYCETEGATSKECKSPQRKKRLTDSLIFDSQPRPQAWSQDPLLSWSQFTDSQPDLSDQKCTTTSSSEPTFPHSLQSEEPFGNLMAVEVRTSTQKSSKHLHSSVMDEYKENSTSLSCVLPNKHSSLGEVSHQKWTDCKTASPQKHVNPMCEKSVNVDSFDLQTMWTKPNCSHVKNPTPQPQSRDVDEESLAALFTQDTQGFRVIAHRGPPARSPLRNQSNLTPVRIRSYKSAVEEEDDMLFTQDSQGNMVIKH